MENKKAYASVITATMLSQMISIPLASANNGPTIFNDSPATWPTENQWVRYNMADGTPVVGILMGM